MGTITTADLLAVQNNITTAHREDLRALGDQIREVRDEQVGQRSDIDQLKGSVEKLTRPGATFELSTKQKAAVASAGIALLGAIADGVRHLVVGAIAAWKSGALIR